MAADKQRTYHKRDRLKQLRAFCHVARFQSITKAAESLYLSQPSISLQVRTLEEDFGTTLFERHGPRIILTSSGKSLYQLAMPLVEGMDRLFDAFAEQVEDEVTGELSISAGETAAMFILPGILKRFRDRHPRVRVQVNDGTGTDGLRRLRAYEVDFAFGAMDVTPDDIDYHRVFFYDILLITPEDHPLTRQENVTLQDAISYPAVLPASHTYSRRVAEAVFRQYGIEPDIAVEAGGWMMIKRYVEAGLGVSFVPGICLTGQEQIAVVPVSQAFPKRSYGVLTLKNRVPSPAAKRFIELLEQEVRARS